MTSSCETVDNLLRSKNPDRVGLVDSPWGDTLSAWVHQGYPLCKDYKEVGEDHWCADDGRWVETTVAGEYEEPVPPWEHFNYDMVGIGPWFDVMPLRDYEEVVSESAEWEAKRNGAGAVLKYWKHKSGTPEHIDFRMVTRDVWERDYRPHLLELDPLRVDLPQMGKSIRRAASASEPKWVHYGHMFIWESMRQSMGDITLYESLLLDPEWVHDYNRVYTDFYKKHFAYMIEKAGKPNGIWLYEDMGYKNGLFASPKVLQEMIFPYYKEMVDFFHSYDLPVILHSCGSTAAALPLIVAAGFDGLNPMERKALNNDPFAFAEQYGDKIAFVGGLDARVFETNDRDIIRREVSTYIDGMKARGARLIFASDHSISPNTHYDSYLYALDVYREHMFY